MLILLDVIQSWSDVKVISPQLGTETDYKFSHRDLSLRRVSRCSLYML